MSGITKATLGRLPLYLKYLRSLDGGDKYVSSSKISAALNLGEVQVKKDLSSVSAKGKPKVGYKKDELILDINNVLSYPDTGVVLVGVGKLGRAILDYDGFVKFGISIGAAFDNDPSKTGKSENGKEILPIDSLKSYCEDHQVKIGIITVPQAYAQSVCDLLTGAGVKAIWNFAPVKLTADENVMIKNEDLSLSLAYLNIALTGEAED